MPAPIRVAHVVSTAGRTGVEAHLLALLPSFDRASVSPVLFAAGPGPMVDDLTARGVDVEYGAPTRKLAFDQVRSLAERWRGRFDVVHAHGPRAIFWSERAARRAGVPAFVATVHELRWRSMPPGLKRELWIALEGQALRGAERLITVSHAAQRDLVARWPRLEERTRVVHASAPILLGPGAPPRSEPGRRDGRPFRLVTIGRFDWAKGYDLLLPALARLAACGVDFTMDIVGHGVLEPRLRAEATRLGIAERIRWLGRDVDLAPLLAASHALVTTTRTEMFGIAVLEAMACGLPVLAPDVGSLVEVVEDGATGRLLPFDPEETLPERMAEELARWWSDPELMRRLGAGGAHRAREVFAPAAFAAKVAAVYDEMRAGGSHDVAMQASFGSRMTGSQA
jgi:glycosyltransferase involved in cell wall biosynthesis